jgi:hypothetical protein
MAEWFPRLADIPNVNYAGSPGVNRKRLFGHNATPQIAVSTFEGKRRESVWWPSRTGETSASPVTQHVSESTQRTDEPSAVLLQQLREALELPGQPIDYHFAIQSCIEELWKWKRRRAEPALLAEIEQLCWLDIRLVEALPHIIAYEHRGEQQYYSITAFHHLIELYEREGFVAEALGVARRAARFAPTYLAQVQAFEQRLAELAAETAP